jgi:DNA-binding response OmpR family regulator
MSRARVLLAEDDRVVSLLLSRSLESLDVDVTAVYDGIEAYEEGRSGGYDLAVLDQVMPGLLGAEILHRWNREGIDLPVIIVSGLTDDEDVVKLLEMGAVDFVRKPFNVREVLARVKLRLRV